MKPNAHAPAAVPAVATGPGTAVAAARPKTLRGLLNDPSIKNEIARALPKHCNGERMARAALTALTRTPGLADCDQASFMQCLLNLSQWGLEPNGRDAHLIPFVNRRRGVTECQLIIDYKGLVQLCYRSGLVESIHADVVYEGDDFYYSMGQVRRHEPHWLRTDADKPASQGAMIAAYAVVKLKGGAVKCEVMPKGDVDKIRSRSKAGTAGPWVTDYAEMAKKTVFRRCSKWLPISAEIVEAFERDHDAPAFRGELLPAPGDGPSTLDALADRLDGPAGEILDHDDLGPDETMGADGELFDRGAPNAAEA